MSNIDDDVEKKRKALTIRGLSGLRNIGNTCYMNSIIQCISSLDIFRSWLISHKFETRLFINIACKLAEINRKKQKLDNDAKVHVSPQDINVMMQSTVVYNLAELLKGMWGQNSIVTPKSFKKAIGDICPTFRGYNQNDSQELLNLIIDKVHEETEKKTVQVTYKNIPECVQNYIEVYSECIDKLNDPDIDIDTKEKYLKYLNDYKKEHTNDVIISNAYISWKKHVQTSHSIITDLFTGLFFNKITCDECNSISSSFEPFTSLSIQTKITGNTTLIESMNEFTKEEILNGDNQYFCETCNKKVNAKKQIYIWEPPNILIIHLKRFKNERWRTTKTSSTVGFPINDFDINNYLSNLHPVKNTIYDLCAISEHRGECNFGHYIAYCKNNINNKWYEFDDSSVYHVPYEELEKELVTKNAYVLFYVRRLNH